MSPLSSAEADETALASIVVMANAAGVSDIVVKVLISARTTVEVPPVTTTARK